MNYSELCGAILDGRITHLTRNEVAVLYRVDPHTVGIWRRQGRLTGTATPSGKRFLYPASQFLPMLTAGHQTQEQPDDT